MLSDVAIIKLDVNARPQTRRCGGTHTCPRASEHDRCGGSSRRLHACRRSGVRSAACGVLQQLNKYREPACNPCHWCRGRGRLRKMFRCDSRQACNQAACGITSKQLPCVRACGQPTHQHRRAKRARQFMRGNTERRVASVQGTRHRLAVLRDGLCYVFGNLLHRYHHRHLRNGAHQISVRHPVGAGWCWCRGSRRRTCHGRAVLSVVAALRHHIAPELAWERHEVHHSVHEVPAAIDRSQRPPKR